jgi:hypothetical protein
LGDVARGVDEGVQALAPDALERAIGEGGKKLAGHSVFTPFGACETHSGPTPRRLRALTPRARVCRRPPPTPRGATVRAVQPSPARRGRTTRQAFLSSAFATRAAPKPSAQMASADSSKSSPHPRGRASGATTARRRAGRVSRRLRHAAHRSSVPGLGASSRKARQGSRPSATVAALRRSPTALAKPTPVGRVRPDREARRLGHPCRERVRAPHRRR